MCARENEKEGGDLANEDAQASSAMENLLCTQNSIARKVCIRQQYDTSWGLLLFRSFYVYPNGWIDVQAVITLNYTIFALGKYGFSSSNACTHEHTYTPIPHIRYFWNHLIRCAHQITIRFCVAGLLLYVRSLVRLCICLVSLFAVRQYKCRSTAGSFQQLTMSYV